VNIGIAHNVPLTVELIKRVVHGAGHRVAWASGSGSQVLQCCAEKPVSALIMSLDLSDIDGVEITGRIMETAPCAILLISDDVDKNMPQIFEAMGRGALDAMETPRLTGDGTINGAEALVKKLRTLQTLTRNGSTGALPKYAHRELPSLIVIGSSTGGPRALGDVLGSVSCNLPAAVVVIQHIDAQFAGGLADWLNGQTELTVSLAPDGARPKVGTVLIAGTNDHLRMTPSQTLQYSAQPIDYPYRPSVDIFFESVAANWPIRSTAVLLTGMGSDGARGLRLLREAGWHTIAQDESSSVVYGMPRAAAELDSAIEILPIGKIAASLEKNCRSKTAKKNKKSALTTKSLGRKG
jgi:two-component system response regulator WspF